MIHAFYASKTGAKNYQSCLDAVANNLANINTDGYKSQEVRFEELIYTGVDTPDGGEIDVAAGGGSRITISRDMSEGPVQLSEDPADGGTLVEKSNVDVIAEMAKLINAQRGFQINSRMIRTADEIEQYANSMRN